MDPLCGTVVSPVQEDDECEAHAAFLVESEGLVFWTVVQPPRLVALRVLSLFSKSHENDIRIPEVDPFGGQSFNFGDGASSKAASLFRFPVGNDALGDFWIACAFVRGSAETDSIDAGYGFSQGTALRHRLW